MGGQNAQNDPTWNASGQGYASGGPTGQAQGNQNTGAPGGGAGWNQASTLSDQQSQPGGHRNVGSGGNYGNSDYQSNTPFVGVTGAGGNFDPANTGTGATGNQQNQGNTATGNNTAGTGYGGSGQGGGQPSVGQRLKGTTEKIVGHVAGDPNMVSRGEARKTGGDPTGTNYNN
ncbi:hypothetical protein CERSUDRAFT_63207 [Gelatoporia subvermispora B]|uniref:Uncharacterized protein n=1 Tax=Ceriporiopsis subvermispora (strain B) TaxID=914234 RepID=M2PSF5_CERS8|nr:hypothetical protein CERSUDRAFT_63207 [Gelatoporia subvermispora B]